MSRALRVCSEPGCPAVTITGTCPDHTPAELPDTRPNAAARGYGAKWDAYSARYRKANPYCRPCQALGRATPTAAVDHIAPVTGPRDPGFWDRANHQPICRSCHAIKTHAEGRTQGTAGGQDTTHPRRRWHFA
jgi:5-methylcytosine-specific restriction protein A